MAVTLRIIMEETHSAVALIYFISRILVLACYNVDKRVFGINFLSF